MKSSVMYLVLRLILKLRTIESKVSFFFRFCGVNGDNTLVQAVPIVCMNYYCDD